MSSLKLSRSFTWVLIVLITLVAAFLRFYELGQQSLWDGEIFTLLFAQYPWSKLVPSVAAFSAHPPLWFALSKIAIAFGWNETILRAPAAFAGILSVPALYALGKRMFDARVGLIGATLLALSPINVIFSQNARNYALFVLLVILLMYAAYRAVNRSPSPSPQRSGENRSPLSALRSTGSTVWWLLFTVAALAGLYTHYLFVLPLAGTVLGIALKLINDAAQQAGGWKDVRGWWGIALVSARPFLIALIAIVALYLPWTPTVGSAFLGRQLTREAAQEDDTTALTLQDVPRLVRDFSGGATWGLVLLAVLAIIGIVWAWSSKDRSARNRQPLFWFAVSLLLPLGIMVLLAPRRLPAKYLIYVLPAYMLLISQGIVGVSDTLENFLQARNSAPRALAEPVISVGLMALVAVAVVPNMPYWNGTQTIFTGKGWSVVDDWRPWREVAQSVIVRAQPGDIILFPEEARALTARSVMPYFDATFLQKLYSAPPTGRVWWISEAQDVPAEHSAQVTAQDNFGQIVVQQWGGAQPLQALELPNASFENGFADWVRTNGGAQWGSDKAQTVDGAAAARIVMRSSDSARLRSTPFPVTPGKLYRVTAYVQAPTVGFYTASPQLFITFTGTSDTPSGRTHVPILMPSDKPGWMLMAADGIVPAGSQSGRVDFLFREYAHALGATSWVDDVKVWLEP